MSAPQLTYHSPKTFTRKQRLLLAVAPPLAAGMFKALYATCRVEVRGQTHWDQLMDEGQHFVSGVWHETVGLAGALYRDSGIHTLTSHSFDGELAARVARCFGMEAIRGSSSRGGMRALGDLKKALEHVPVVGLTFDGPRGPRRKAKPGAAILAAKAGVPLLPFGLAAYPNWRLNTWDRLIIPKPRARILCAYGPPIPPPKSTAKTDVRATLQAFEDQLNALQLEVEAEVGEDPERRGIAPPP